ncbi:MAG TPA: OmpA family protein [Candidatus Ozemobacteraceae bacterium]|nr:OmpA family protein [Candidatus Ozemobacteraceae bacterium]
MARKGYILLLVILGAISLGFFGLTLTSLNRGYRSQVVHTRQMQTSFQIGYSGYQRILARLYLKPWEERFFAGSPKAEAGFALYGGTYDTYCIDAPGNPNQADIYIRVKLEGMTRTYVWRIEHVPSLLDARYVRTILFGEIENADYPSGSAAGYSQKINDLMQTRETNRPKADDLRTKVNGVTTLEDVTSLLNAPRPVLPASHALPIDHPPAEAPAISDPGPLTEAGPGNLIREPGGDTSTPKADELSEKMKANGKIISRILFYPERYDILPESYPILESVKKMLENMPHIRVSVEGHIALGHDSDSAQVEFSRRRAEVVKQWLVDHGIAASRLVTKGWGDQKPIYENDTATHKKRNRRVEFVRIP